MTNGTLSAACSAQPAAVTWPRRGKRPESDAAAAASEQYKALAT